jgi:hypothetical protein
MIETTGFAMLCYAPPTEILRVCKFLRVQHHFDPHRHSSRFIVQILNSGIPIIGSADVPGHSLFDVCWLLLITWYALKSNNIAHLRGTAFLVKQDQPSHRVNRTAEQKQVRDKPRTDWLAWSLQLALGFVVGLGASFPIVRLLFRSGFISFDQMFLAMVGGALCCGAFAAYHGDRAWIRTSIFNWPELPRTEPARRWSIITGCLGGSLVLVPIGVHLLTVGWPSSGSRSRGFSFFTLLLAAVPGFLLVHALRTGTGFWRFGILDREETPLFFWIYVFVMAVGVICILI